MSNDPVDGGTVRYHRAEYDSGDDIWRVWFRPTGGYYAFSGAEGEAMGLTPPEPAPLQQGRYWEVGAERDEARRQLDTLRNAIEPALDALRGWDMLGPGGTGDREWALGQLDRIAGALAAAGGGVSEEGATDE